MKLFFIFFIFLVSLYADYTVSYLYPNDKKLTISEIIPDTEAQMISKDKYLQLMPFDKKNISWMKLVLKNDLDVEQVKVVQFLDIRIDKLIIYNQDGKEIYCMGDKIAFDSRELKDAQIAFKIDLRAKEEKTIYINNVFVSTAGLSFKVHNLDQYTQNTHLKHMEESAFFAVLLVMLIYNTVLYLFVRERLYFYYISYHLSLLFIMYPLKGLSVMYHHPSLMNVDAGAVKGHIIILTALTSAQFLRSYLNTKKYTPRLDQYLFKIIIIDFILFLLYFFDLMPPGQFSVVVELFHVLFLFIIALYFTYTKRTIESYIYTLAWTIMLSGVGVTSFVALGFLTRNDFTTYAVDIGIIFELIIFSMALAYRYVQQQKVLSSKEQELRFINHNLERTVTLRTQELEEEIKRKKNLLLERETLFKELYHRVKNNLQMMVSLISMQKRRLNDNKAKYVLDDISGRIKSLALIHEQLQDAHEFDSINLQEYISALLNEIRSSYSIAHVTLEIECGDIFMNIDQVTSLGLIINELANNSFKHAFKELSNPKITLKMQEDKDYTLYYTDNGIGNSKIENSDSLGSLLVNTLVKSQLKGEIKIEVQPSVNYNISFAK